MNKLLATCLLASLTATSATAQLRYLDDVFSTTQTTSGPLHDNVCADLDGDGVAELVVLERRVYVTLRVYDDSGRVIASRSFSVIDPDVAIAAGRFAGSSRDELVLVTKPRATRVEVNVLTLQSSNLSTRATTSFPVADPAINGSNLDVAVGDFDGDSINEFAVSCFGTSGRTVTQRCELSGSTITSREDWLVAGHHKHALAAADIDGDGDDEMVMSYTAGGYCYLRTWYIGWGNLVYAYGNAQIRVYDDYTSVAAGDLDNDGRDDIAVSTLDGSNRIALLVYELNSQNQLSRTADWRIPAIRGHAPVTACDLDQDLFDEFVIATVENNSHVQVRTFDYLRTTVTETTSIYTGSAPTLGGSIALSAGDIDGDGRDDLAVTAVAGTVQRIGVWESGLSARLVHGCRGSRGFYPVLADNGRSGLRLYNAPAQRSGFFIISLETYEPYWDLAVLGASGCYLVPTPTILVPFTSSSTGTAAMAGLPRVDDIYCQAIVLDPSVNALGALLTNAMEKNGYYPIIE
jgi:hypothetical protein